MRPYLLVSLSNLGDLQIEFPHRTAPRTVPLNNLSQLTRILRGMSRNEKFMGEEGAPTSHQARHWDHVEKKRFDQKCPFCLAEKYLREGGKITSKGVKLKLEDFRDLDLEGVA